MRVLTRRLTWRNPYGVERLPAIARLHRLAYAGPPRLRFELMRMPLRLLFSVLYRLGLGGRGVLLLKARGVEKPFDFDSRNLQFASLYMPQYAHGYEPETVALLEALVGSEGVFYDVGSNWGYYAVLIASREGFTGRVHAFEPLPSSFRDLEDLVARAGLSASVACHPVGLSDRTGTGHMTVPDRLHSGCAAVTAGGGGAEIILKRLDEMAIDPPGVVKIDVEDHEAQVLAGARQTLSSAKPHIVFESWLKPGRPAETLGPFQTLAQLGYVFFHPAWLAGPGGRNCPAGEAPSEGEAAVLALVPFEPVQRFLFKEQLNVFACHGERLAQLERTFDGAGPSPP